MIVKINKNISLNFEIDKDKIADTLLYGLKNEQCIIKNYGRELNILSMHIRIALDLSYTSKLKDRACIEAKEVWLNVDIEKAYKNILVSTLLKDLENKYFKPIKSIHIDNVAYMLNENAKIQTVVIKHYKENKEEHKLVFNNTKEFNICDIIKYSNILGLYRKVIALSEIEPELSGIYMITTTDSIMISISRNHISAYEL